MVRNSPRKGVGKPSVRAAKRQGPIGVPRGIEIVVRRVALQLDDLIRVLRELRRELRDMDERINQQFTDPRLLVASTTILDSKPPQPTHQSPE